MPQPPRSHEDLAIRPRHRLLLELGRGGMGTVYLAMARGPGGFSKLKVVKRLRPDLAQDPQFLEMFLDEARLSARLNHANIVQTFEVGFDGVNYFLEMEYLEGQTLDAISRRAARAGGWPLGHALWAVHQTLEGLHYAHELTDAHGEPLDVVHRDVSPHNVFVTYDGTVKVLDFGIAKAADSSIDTRTGVVKGKATYMAPEQAAREPVDRRADIFAVGVILWQVLTGARLWGDSSDSAIFEKLTRGEIPSPRSVKPDVPEALDAACMKALARRPEDRFATAAEMQDALAAYLETTNTKVGNKTLGAFVATLFEERRRAVRAEIDAQMREPDTIVDRGLDVPALDEAAAVRATASGSLSTAHTKPDGERRRASRASRPTAPRARAAMRWVFACAGVIVIGGGALFYRVKRDGSPAAPVASSSSVASAAPIGDCTTNRACVARLGAAAICRKDTHTCAKLESEDCRVLAEPNDVEDDATVFIGSMFPRTGPLAADIGIPSENAVDLGRRDFAALARAKGQADPTAPPLAVVACDDEHDAWRPARHLAETLHVPAIIGFRSSKSVLDLATGLFIPREVLTIAALNASPFLSSIPQPEGKPRFVYRTAANLAHYAPAIAALVSDIVEPAFRASPAHRDMRVAVLRPSAAAGRGYADTLIKSLRFNGRGAAENGASYREITYPDVTGDELARALRAMVPDLIAFAPDVVVFPSDAEILPLVVMPLERALAKRGARPVYLTTELFQSNDQFAFFHESADRGARFLVVNQSAATIANRALTSRYNEVFTPKLTAERAPSTAYDSFYVVGYAAAAAHDATGAAIAAAVTRLNGPGRTIDVGPNQIVEALQDLRKGNAIALRGAATTLHFDPETGDALADFVVYCTTVDAASQSVRATESSARYDAASRKFDAPKVVCPAR